VKEPCEMVYNSKGMASSGATDGPDVLFIIRYSGGWLPHFAEGDQIA